MDFSNLQSRASSAYIPPHRTQLHPRMHSFSSFASPNPKPSQPRDRWWVLLAAVLIVPFLFYLFAIARGIHKSSKFDEWRPKGFGVIINAGSTGSTIHVFEFLNEGRIPFVGYDGKGSNSMKVRPGLSEFRDDPGRAGSSILSLVEFAKARVPKSEWKKTKVRLMGTGDLGRLDMDVRKAILESCRLVLRSSGFLFKDEWASVITGQEEGVYAWVAANYALGTLGGDPKETTGIIQLAEGSIQVTFSPRGSLPIQFSRVIELVGVTYNLYSESTFHFGQDEAWASVLGLHSSQDLGSFLSSSEGIMKNPCIPKGYSQKLNQAEINTSDGKQLASQLAGNFSACRSEALALLQKGKDECFHPPCKIVSSFLPKILGNTVPPDTFYYTSELFGMVPRASLSELEAAGRHYCEDDWHKLRDEHEGIDEIDLLKYCFSSAYIVALVHDSLGISMDDKRIGFANHGGSIPLDWTLGAFILQTVVEPLELEPENLGQVVGNDSVAYLTLFIVLFLAILAAFYVTKWQKPQLKTVYDLEKGHYIITRVPR